MIFRSAVAEDQMGAMGSTVAQVPWNLHVLLDTTTRRSTGATGLGLGHQDLPSAVRSSRTFLEEPMPPPVQDDLASGALISCFRRTAPDPLRGISGHASTSRCRRYWRTAMHRRGHTSAHSRRGRWGSASRASRWW